jgi:hypothetical protein
VEEVSMSRFIQTLQALFFLFFMFVFLPLSMVYALLAGG